MPEDFTPSNTPLAERLQAVDRDLKHMAEIVVVAVGRATEALLANDVDRAQTVIEEDDILDAYSLEYERSCMDLLVCSHLDEIGVRSVVTALKMNSEIERSGDLAVNICKGVGRIQGAYINRQIRNFLRHMGEEAGVLFSQAIKFYVERDEAKAATLTDLDDRLDDLHDQYIEVVIRTVSRGELNAQQGLQLAVLGRFYERIGDHAVNIAEGVRHLFPESEISREREKRFVPSKENNMKRVLARRIPGVAVIEAAQQERRIDAIRRDFVVNVSHELKTPVGAIALLAETLYDEEDIKVRRRLLHRITDEAHRVSETIDDLIDLGRLEEEKQPRHVSVFVYDIVSSGLNHVYAFATQKEVEIQIQEFPAGLSVRGDARQLGRALSNLFDNAVKYSDPGHIVTVGAKQVGDKVDIRVQDQGIGIPARDIERIFERFYRVDRARSRATGGTGLGLAIVRHVMTNHNGRVLVESSEGEGSAFTLQLPSAGEHAETPERQTRHSE